jgi:glycine oxidase
VSRETDCVIIGGGVMGCSIALRLSQAGVRTTVLERSIPGAEASSAAAGILAGQEESEGPGPLTTLSIASRARFAALAEELRALTGIDIAYRKVGVLSLAATAADEERLERRYGWQRDAGQRLEWLRGRELAACEPHLAPGWRSGLYCPDDHQLDPRPYARALSQAAAAAGARFVTGAYVRRVVHDGTRVQGVELDGERIEAAHVVVAAGSWSSLVEGITLPPSTVKPVRGQIVLCETRPPAVRGTIVSPGGYVVGRADGRVLCGSTMEQAGYDRSVTAGGLAHVLGLALAIVPSLASAPVIETWANFRPTTDDHLPILGEANIRGLVFATGHFRNGILLSPITAEIVRDLVTTGRAAHFDAAAFSPARVLGS